MQSRDELLQRSLDILNSQGSLHTSVAGYAIETPLCTVWIAPVKEENETGISFVAVTESTVGKVTSPDVLDGIYILIGSDEMERQYMAQVQNGVAVARIRQRVQWVRFRFYCSPSLESPNITPQVKDSVERTLYLLEGEDPVDDDMWKPGFHAYLSAQEQERGLYTVHVWIEPGLNTVHNLDQMDLVLKTEKGVYPLIGDYSAGRITFRHNHVLPGEYHLQFVPTKH